MAFDRPIEADKVEDNLLLNLVRGPILGGILWILGEDDNNNKDEKRLDKELQQGLQDMVMSEDDYRDDAKSALPRLVRSDLSVAMGEDTSQNDNYFHHPTTSSSGVICRQTEKKKMSWSENLVEYMDDESLRHEPPSSTHGSSAAMMMSKPIKSAMTRSSSVRAHPLGIEEGKERKIRYLPNGLDRAHNGLIMPTRPMGMGGGVSNDHRGDGNEGLSPQWGWYINTTPPTPEMYHSRSSLKTDKSYHSATSSFSSVEAASVVHPAAVSSRGPNRVFQGLKAGSNRPPVGWPSVPL